MFYKAKEVVFPKSKIRRVIRVLHDGTLSEPRQFSIAEIELADGKTAFGIRHTINRWNEENPEIGYPTCRPGKPTWFLLPGNIDEMIKILERR